MSLAPSPSLELSLSGVVIRALRLSFAIFGNIKSDYNKNSHVPDTDLSECNSIFSELGDLFNNLTASEPWSSTRHDVRKILIEIAKKVRRLVGDLIVHLEDCQQVGGKYGQTSELKPGFHSIWTEEDRAALEHRLSGLKDSLVDRIIPALK